jgi:hypothetical protein
MPRWYKAFQCGGIHPEVLSRQIESLVQRNGLVRVIPAVRFEKRSSKRGFYLFLAVESPEIGEVPENIRSTVLNLSTLGHPIGEFTLDQIRCMVSAEYGFHSYANLIPYSRHILPPVSNPFEEIGVEGADDLTASDEIAMRTQQYDRLLVWLSAIGHGGWQVFQNTCQSLGIKDNPQQVLRRLRLLGHIETSADRKRWVMAPSVVLPITSGENVGQWVLCGRRDTKLLQSFRQYTGVEIIPQEYGEGPATAYLRVETPEHLATILETMGRPVYQVEQTGLRLAQALPSLEEWKQSLEQLQGIRPHAFTLKCFNGDSFAEVNFSGKSGLYELWPLDGRLAGQAVTRPEYILYYDAIGERWLRADWYSLRFLARYETGQSCPVLYRAALSQIAVPFDWRWPEIYERALVLASGRLPERRKGWLIYDNVGIELFEALRYKLRLSDEDTSNA